MTPTPMRTRTRRRRFGTLVVQPLFESGNEAIGDEDHDCCYCGVSLASTRCLVRWGKSGFGRRRAADRERFCDRRCRGLFDQRGPKWSNVARGRSGWNHSLSEWASTNPDPDTDERAGTDATSTEAQA